MITFGNKYTLWMGAFFVFAFDQLTKILALNHLDHEEEIILNKMFSFLRIYNKEYIMLDYNVFVGDFALKQMWHFQLLYLICALILMVGIIWVTNQKPLLEKNWITEFAKSGLFLIMGGMLGNLFDRLFRKDGVVDFIQLNMFTSSYPIFNIADVVIYLGEFCLVVAWILILKEKTKELVKQKTI